MIRAYSAHYTAFNPDFKKTMADINVENFYQHIARILNILYSSFPTKTPVYVDEIAGVDNPDEYGLHSPTYTSCFFAMLWLAEEGYLRYENTIRQDGIDQACLTHKAFLKLTRVCDTIYTSPQVPSDSGKVVNISPVEKLSPSIVEERHLVINQLRSALDEASSIAIGKVVSHILAD